MDQAPTPVMNRVIVIDSGSTRADIDGEVADRTHSHRSDVRRSSASPRDRGTAAAA